MEMASADEDRLQLEQMRSKEFLTDVTLIAADGTHFPAHAALLAASSSFFSAFFRNDPSKTKEINLPLLSPQSLAKCLEVAYLSSTVVNRDDVEDVLSAACFLQQRRAIALCEKFLQSVVTLSDFDQISQIADRFGLSETQQAVQLFLERKIDKLARKDRYLSRMSRRQIADLLTSDRLAVDETELLRLARRWLEISGEVGNPQCVSQLLRNIRLMLVDHNSLVDLLPIARDLSNGPEPIDPTAFQRVYDALEYLSKPQLQHCVENYQNKVRARRRVAIRVAGKALFSNSEEKLSVEVFAMAPSDDPGRVEVITTLPEQPVSHHQTVCMNGFVFVMGGARTICQRGLTAVNTVWRLDPRSKRWWKAAPMLENRAYFAAGSVDGTIYVCGGEYRFQSSKTCEAYDSKTNTWTYKAPLEEVVSGNTGCSVGGCFYSIGGWKGSDSAGSICSEVWRYNPKDNTWTRMADLQRDRAFHCCVAVESLRRIYVFGGVDHRKRPISFGEYFDLDGEQVWKATEAVPTMHNEGSCFQVFDQNNSEKVVGICLCGGYDASNKPQSSMSLLNIEAHKWSTWDSSTHHVYHRFAGSCFVTVDLPIITFPANAASAVVSSTSSSEHVGWVILPQFGGGGGGGGGSGGRNGTSRWVVRDARPGTAANRNFARSQGGPSQPLPTLQNNNDETESENDDDDEDDDVMSVS